MSQSVREKGEQSTTRIRKISVLTLTILSVILVGWVGTKMLQHWRARQLFDDAMQQGALGLLDKAEKNAWKAWQIDQTLPEALGVAAQFAAQQGRYAETIQYLDKLDINDPLLSQELKEMAFHLRGDSFQSLGDVSKAERDYRELLALNPDHAAGCLSYAKLLGTCGRRDETIPLILRLVKLGAAGDLLMLLARESGAIQNEAYLKKATQKYPSDPLPWTALAVYAFDANDEVQCRSLLDTAIKSDPSCIPAITLQLRLFAKQDRWDQVRSLWDSLTSETQESLRAQGMVWLIQGQYHERQFDLSSAIGCYAEALKRRPDSRVAISRLATLLSQSGNAASAAVFSDYLVRIQKLWEVQDRVLFTQTPRTLTDLLLLVESYAICGRVWEAYGWCQLGIQIAPNSQELIAELKAFEKAMENEPFQLVTDRLSPLSKADLKQFTAPKWIFTAPQTSTTVDLNQQTDPAIRFVDEANERGIQFTFHDGTDGPIRHLMFELTGGGIGVLDYDLDGWPDLAFSQGRPWPPEADKDSSYRDTLYRNVQGQKFSAPIVLPLERDGFGQGVGIGDVNDDGFPDIYIAQTHENRLLINSGDGTFYDATEASGLWGEAWTTSCLIADLNNDGFADLYDVNYVSGEDIFSRTCLIDNHVVQCKPTDFESERDVLWLNDGQGGFVKQADTLPPKARGLGAVAFRNGSTNGMQMLVTNDVEPNFLLNFTRPDDGSITAEDSGVYSGVAFNENGKAEGSMGIAVHDLNSDGQLDFVITNFLAESNTLYQSVGEGLYADRTKTAGLEPLSYDYLGFGTQFLDANNDGVQELFVSNGHVDDLTVIGKPYRMLPQLLSYRATRFHLLKGAGDYFSRELLGRSVVKVDWNRDGKMDLVVGHLRDNYSLLTNQSESKSSSIALRLIGTKSNRDAVGAIVTVSGEGKKVSQQITSGDGYQCSNCRELHFLVDEKAVHEIRIDWPSGKTDIMVGPVDGIRLTVVE
ncbi:MAG: FG-GAP-like repeat-containing protein [Pirellula sp.]|jgi:tetratricopeptide (TPR) repeat protein|nr:FG-GAP-like repeat-containing protein [Pirellula sp.]